MTFRILEIKGSNKMFSSYTLLTKNIRGFIFIFFLYTVSLLMAQGTPGLLFTLTEGGTAYEVSKGTANASHIDIPEIYNELPVKRIADSGFEGDETIISINIPQSIFVIGSAAFSGCSSLSSINIPSGVNHIYPYTFQDCTALNTVSIPNSILIIYQYSFAGCISLTTITIPNGVTYLGFRAFDGCSSLSSVMIPNTIEQIPENPFTYCENLVSIIVEEDNPYYRSEGNCLINIIDQSLITGTKNSVIPEGIVSISENSFAGCSGLTSIIIPESVTDIGITAFFDCIGLILISIPDSVTSIGIGAFFNCSELITVTLGNNLSSISENAFTGCSSLASITIPNSVLTINNEAFASCTNLATIILSDNIEELGSYTFFNCSSLSTIFLPISVESVGYWTFSGCSSLTIYAEAMNQPPGWDSSWNPDDLPVVWGGVSSVDKNIETVQTALQSNYPNPFNPETTIHYTLKNTTNVLLEIYNVKGQRVLILINKVQQSGFHQVSWNGINEYGQPVSSGMYFYSMITDDYHSVKSMILIK